MSIRDKFEACDVQKLNMLKDNLESSMRNIQYSINDMLRYMNDENFYDEGRVDTFCSGEGMRELRWLLESSDTKIFFEILKEYQKVVMEIHNIDEDGIEKTK